MTRCILLPLLSITHTQRLEVVKIVLNYSKYRFGGIALCSARCSCTHKNSINSIYIYILRPVDSTRIQSMRAATINSDAWGCVCAAVLLRERTNNNGTLHTLLHIRTNNVTYKHCYYGSINDIYVHRYPDANAIIIKYVPELHCYSWFTSTTLHYILVYIGYIWLIGRPYSYI